MMSNSLMTGTLEWLRAPLVVNIKPGQKVSVEFDTEIKNPAYTGAPYGIPCVKDSMMVFADPRKTVTAGEADLHLLTRACPGRG